MKMHTTAILLGMLLGLAAQLGAQGVEGVVVDDGSGSGVSGADVVIRASDGDVMDRQITDEGGRFLSTVELGNVISVTVSRLGYHTFTSDPIPVRSGERLMLQIRLGVDAIPVEPLVVSSPPPWYPPDVQAFYDRLERGRRSGDGHYISRAEIEAAHASRATDLLRALGGVRVVRNRAGYGPLVQMRGGCIPSIYVDGTYMNRVDTRLSLDDYVPARAIEGIEVYRGAGRFVRHMNDPRGCGLILVWTRRGEPDSDGSIGWKTIGAVAAALAALLLLTR